MNSKFETQRKSKKRAPTLKSHTCKTRTPLLHNIWFKMKSELTKLHPLSKQECVLTRFKGTQSTILAKGCWIWIEFVYHLQSQDCVWIPEVFLHTQNGQPENHEEQCAEFNKKCIGLESWTAPLRSWQHSEMTTKPGAEKTTMSWFQWCQG